MRIKIIMLSLLAVTAGVFAYTRQHNAVPSDLRDAVADSPLDTLKTEAGTEASRVSVTKPAKPFSVETGSGRESFNKGYVAADDPSAGVPTKPVKWVTIKGGKFKMGTDSSGAAFYDAKPVHEVAIKTFDMSETDVTVEQYKECVLKGACTEPGLDKFCNWGVKGRQLHPVNCVTWEQADKYAEFKSKQPGFEGARLPSEAEWEYAATSGGRNQEYPWGADEPDCDKAVMYEKLAPGCGENSTWAVCSKTAGNTAQGLCDMAGNVHQWVQDTYHDSYEGAPVDGSDFKGAGAIRVVRGGSFLSHVASSLRADYRNAIEPQGRNGGIGFRLARDAEHPFFQKW